MTGPQNTGVGRWLAAGDAAALQGQVHDETQ
jgi:hypothetical protein